MKKIYSTALALLAALMLVSNPAAASQEIVEPDSVSSETFNCKPGSVPETSYLAETRENLKKVLHPDTFRKKYPEECRSWNARYEVSSSETVEYRMEVMKYVGEDWDAVLIATEDGEPASYADVKLNGQDVGNTGPKGMLKMDLPEEEFDITVRRSGNILKLEGSR